jgi:hypothetical protein
MYVYTASLSLQAEPVFIFIYFKKKIKTIKKIQAEARLDVCVHRFALSAGSAYLIFYVF